MQPTVLQSGDGRGAASSWDYAKTYFIYECKINPENLDSFLSTFYIYIYREREREIVIVFANGSRNRGSITD